MLQLPSSNAQPLPQIDLVDVGQLLETNVAQYFDTFNTWSKLGQERNVAAAAQHPELDFSCCRGDGPEWGIIQSIGDANGYSDASERLAKIGDNIDDLSQIVESTAPNTIEELRAYAWSALYDCFPVMLEHGGQFHFQNEVAFERLFNAVLHATGLAPMADKMLEHWAKESDVSAPR
jgi:hypothetical protein